MRISPINYNYYKPSFKSTTRTTYISNSDGVFVLPSYNRQLGKTKQFSSNSDVKMINSNTTNFFRRDIDWKTLGKIFKKQFPQGKVNIYDFACSDGSEAYSLIITLIEQLGEKNAQRFFPIIASDVDEEIIRMANSKKIVATSEDIFSMGNIIKDGNIKKYFSITELGGEKFLLTPKEILTKNVTFKKESIVQGLDEIQKQENNIILARNFWKYLSREDLINASWKLGEKTNKKTLLLIGNFDLASNCCYPYFLEALGFDYHDENELADNILRKKEEYINPKTTSFVSWKDFVEGQYPRYIPSYIR